MVDTAHQTCHDPRTTMSFFSFFSMSIVLWVAVPMSVFLRPGIWYKEKLINISNWHSGTWTDSTQGLVNLRYFLFTCHGHMLGGSEIKCIYIATEPNLSPSLGVGASRWHGLPLRTPHIASLNVAWPANTFNLHITLLYKRIWFCFSGRLRLILRQ
jgi:hypothetical protein